MRLSTYAACPSNFGLKNPCFVSVNDLFRLTFCFVQRFFFGWFVLFGVDVSSDVSFNVSLRLVFCFAQCFAPCFVLFQLISNSIIKMQLHTVYVARGTKRNGKREKRDPGVRCVFGRA